MIEKLDFSDVPIKKIQWGDLYRTGYHFGIEHIHQFYTLRNVFVLSKLWKKVSEYPANIQQALKVFLLSYNQSHSTLMTRVVAKKNNKDFVLTGAQPGVLYISSLPVEKNILNGLRRKIKTFSEGIKILESSTSEVCFVSGSSVSTSIASNSIDYVFTDPPFGGYIPYSEINQINELWYGVKTDVSDEVIINGTQGKSLIEYQKLMSNVFAEISRCIKVNGQCTVVFHSAKSAIWRAIIKAYQTNGFSVSKTGILDKVQASFKQVNSTITVKGDPLILLAKRTKCTVKENYASDVCIAEQILKSHQSENKGKEKSERMFSEYIAECIEKGITITLDAEYFFNHE